MLILAFAWFSLNSCCDAFISCFRTYWCLTLNLFRFNCTAVVNLIKFLEIQVEIINFQKKVNKNAAELTCNHFVINRSNHRLYGVDQFHFVFVFFFNDALFFTFIILSILIEFCGLRVLNSCRAVSLARVGYGDNKIYSAFIQI